MKPMDIKILKSDFHRNGISGLGFQVTIFEWKDDENSTRTMVGIRFDEQGAVAVFDLEELAKQNIEFGGGNSWRGDNFEPHLPGTDGKIF